MKQISKNMIIPIILYAFSFLIMLVKWLLKCFYL